METNKDTMHQGMMGQDARNQGMMNQAPTFDTLYASLSPQHVEQFYRSYSAWQMRQKMVLLEAHLTSLDQQINDNAVLMQLVQPSALSLATLARLQSYGVEDIDLLDAMLERGDEWLDHAMQLLTQCELLDLIHDNYTEWCRHALEGAYNWLDSINEPNIATHAPPRQASVPQTTTGAADLSVTTGTTNTTHTMANSPDSTLMPNLSESIETTDMAYMIDSVDSTSEETAELLLRKLMSDPEDEPIQEVATDTVGIDTIESIRSIDTQSDEDASQEDSVESVNSVENDNDENNEATLESPAPVEEQHREEQKPPGRSLVSRVLAKVWNVS